MATGMRVFTLGTPWRYLAVSVNYTQLMLGVALWTTRSSDGYPCRGLHLMVGPLQVSWLWRIEC